MTTAKEGGAAAVPGGKGSRGSRSAKAGEKGVEVPGAGAEGANPINPVTARLQELGVNEEVGAKIISELGAASVDDLSGLTETDLISVGMKALPARALLKALAPVVEPVVVAPVVTSAAANAMSTVSFDSLLPSVPTDAAWLDALRTGGILKVDKSTVTSAVRAALAHKVGLFGIPKNLVKLMEDFADTNDEQVDAEFFKLRKMLTRNTYGEIFEAIDGLDGSYVTDARKKQLFDRIDQNLWPAITAFYDQLKSWQEAWVQGAANPAIMMSSFMSMAGGGGMGVMPPGMMQPPETGILRDTADAFNDSVNRVFAGTGAQIASALAYEATRIKETLENPRLPALTGAANRDQMLKQLNVAVSATYPRLETNVTRFALSVMAIKDQPAGAEELQYFGALFMLGSQIPWDQLGGGSGRRLSGIGGGSKI